MKRVGKLKRLILAIWDHKTRSMWVTSKGVGRIYQQTFVDTYSKVAFAKLYTTKTPITAADVLNDKVLPFFEKHELPMLRILPTGERNIVVVLITMIFNCTWLSTT